MFLRVLPLLALAAWAADDTIYKVGGEVSPPKIIERVQPEYSQRARDSQIEGKVALGLIIEADGRASHIKVKSALHEDLDRNAVAALEKWRFEPATRQGKPVRVEATLEIVYRLANISLPK